MYSEVEDNEEPGPFEQDPYDIQALTKIKAEQLAETQAWAGHHLYEAYKLMEMDLEELAKYAKRNKVDFVDLFHKLNGLRAWMSINIRRAERLQDRMMSLGVNLTGRPGRYRIPFILN